ncbi:MAG: hypothetical protein IH612_04250 [Desulfofustis sp.]|nr:hypothetical protein [Desulfofustis sp.]
MGVTDSYAPFETAPFEKSLTRVLEWAKKQDYEGYSKFDAFNSPIVTALCLGNKYLRMAATVLWSRSFLNLRPLLLTKKYRNPKGIALFSMAKLKRYAWSGDEADLSEANELLNWLDLNDAKGAYHGRCWGYDHPWQALHYYAPRWSPNIVVTGNVAHAFLDGFEATGEERWFDVARGSIEFILKDLTATLNEPDMRNIGYIPGASWGALNNSGLAASVMMRVWKQTGEERLHEEARRLINFLVDKQTDYGAWFYAWPAKTSNVAHDNYHTGNVLDWILDYITLSGDKTFMPNYLKGLEYYRTHLFTATGAPKWRHNRSFPHDVHGSAQGIVTFSKAATEVDSSWFDQAVKVAGWAVNNMQDTEGWFIYQKGRIWTKRFTLMRWCNGWMSFGLASLLKAKRDIDMGVAVSCVE